jgi:hypothetical protein
MAQGRKRGVALVAALAVITGERVRDRPRLLAAPAGPAAERAIDRGLPAPSRLKRGFRRGDPGRPGQFGDNRGGCPGLPPSRGRRPGPPAPRGRHNDSLPYQLAIHGRAESTGIPASYAPRAGVRETPASCCRIRRRGVRHAHYLVGVIPPTVR